jgi:uncharacterized caspase-like protein
VTNWARCNPRAPDGAYYYVIAKTDPGAANWLDTMGAARGVIQLSYDGVRAIY